MKVKVKRTNTGITKLANEMSLRARTLRPFWMRVVYPYYQEVQMERWMTEGKSQTDRWPALNEKYRKWKERRYGGGARYRWIGGQGVGGTKFDSQGRPRPWEEHGTWKLYPGAGRRMMVATGALANSVIGKGFGDQAKGHYVLATNKALTIGTRIPYASHANDKRPFFRFKLAFHQKIRRAAEHYIRTGEMIAIRR